MMLAKVIARRMSSTDKARVAEIGKAVVLCMLLLLLFAGLCLFLHPSRTLLIVALATNLCQLSPDQETARRYVDKNGRVRCVGTKVLKSTQCVT
jgi:hypothetical protein